MGRKVSKKHKKSHDLHRYQGLVAVVRNPVDPLARRGVGVRGRETGTCWGRRRTYPRPQITSGVGRVPTSAAPAPGTAGWAPGLEGSRVTCKTPFRCPCGALQRHARRPALVPPPVSLRTPSRGPLISAWAAARCRLPSPPVYRRAFRWTASCPAARKLAIRLSQRQARREPQTRLRALSPLFLCLSVSLVCLTSMSKQTTNSLESSRVLLFSCLC